MRSKIFVTALTAVVGVALAVGVGLTQEQPPVDITQVTDGLYMITGPGGNVGVRVTSEGVVVIDDKFEDNYADITSRIESVTDEPIRYVFNTHHHPDHTGSNLQFGSVARVLAHENVRTNMLSASQPGPPAIVYTDQAAVHLGGGTVQAHHVGRGHTNGDSVIYFPDLRIVHAGDLFIGGTPYIDYDGGGSAVEWLNTLDNILEMDFDTVIPGHGNLMTKTDMQTFRDTFQRLQDAGRRLISEGVSENDFAARLAAEVPSMSYETGFASRSLPRLYAELSN